MREVEVYVNSRIDIHVILIAVSTLILFFFITNPQSLRHYFKDSIGRTVLLLFIVNLTYIHPFFGIAASIVVLGVYNFMVFTMEGGNQPLLSEGYTNIHESLSPSFYGMERNHIITRESYMRPKSSNSLMVKRHVDVDDKVYYSEPKPHG